METALSAVASHHSHSRTMSPRANPVCNWACIHTIASYLEESSTLRWLHFQVMGGVHLGLAHVKVLFHSPCTLIRSAWSKDTVINSAFCCLIYLEKFSWNFSTVLASLLTGPLFSAFQLFTSSSSCACHCNWRLIKFFLHQDQGSMEICEEYTMEEEQWKGRTDRRNMISGVIVSPYILSSYFS